MPINRLTNRDAEPPRLGVIRKGDKKQQKEKDGKKYEVVGRDRDTFRVVFDSQYKSFEPIFTDLYTDAPVEFRNIMLLGSTPDEIFPSWYEEHVSAKLLHRCDGEHQVSRFVNGENVHDNAPCIREAKPPCNCHERGWLRIVLMDFTVASGVWGYFQVETGSIYDIIALNTYLRFIDGIQSTRGLRFVLGRSPRMISVPDPKDKNKRSKREMNLLYLMVEPEQTKKYLVQRMQEHDQLALSGQVDASTGEIIQQTALPANTGEKEMSWGTSNIDDPFVPPEYQFNETDVESITAWDFEVVQTETAHLFNHDAHFGNLVHQLEQNGTITNDMTTTEVIAIIKSNRADRRDEKLTDGSWWLDKELVKQFCSNVNTVTGLTANQMLHAIGGDNAKGFGEFKGMSREEAWARCLIASTEGDYDAARAKANDPMIQAWISDIFVQSLPPADLTGDIPF